MAGRPRAAPVPAPCADGAPAGPTSETAQRARLAERFPPFPCSRCHGIEVPARYADPGLAELVTDARTCAPCLDWQRWRATADAHPEIVSRAGGVVCLGGIAIGTPPAWWR